MRLITFQFSIAVICCLLLGAFSSNANADEFDRRLKTVYIAADLGLSTYKSKLVDSNDTGTIISAAIGANVGSEKPVSILLRQDQSTIKFLLNDSAIASSWQDTVVRYRWGYLYCGGIMTSTNFEVKSAGADLFAGTGSGFGANLGVMFPVGNRNLFTVDYSSVAASKFVEKNDQDVKMGARVDINMSANIGITRDNLDVIVGYKQRTHGISYLGTSYSDVHTATFFGFQAGADF